MSYSEQVDRRHVPDKHTHTSSQEQPLEVDDLLVLVSSPILTLRAKGISGVANLLKGGLFQSAFMEEELEKKRASRQMGKLVAKKALVTLYPEINQDYIDACIDGGAEEDWFNRVLENDNMINQLENYQQGCTKTLTSLFGIRNFHRFSLEHWIRQYEERERSKKDHVPFFMSNLDLSDNHLKSATIIEQMEENCSDLLSLRVYEWATDTQLYDQLFFSASMYGPAKRNLYILAHGSCIGIIGGIDPDHGKIKFHDLSSNGIPEAIAEATDESASVVVVSCNTAQNLDYTTTQIYGNESFAERLSTSSRRCVIAPLEEIRLAQLKFVLNDPHARVTPVFYDIYYFKFTLGKTFPIPNTPQRSD